MADKEQVEIIKKGTQIWHQWRNDHPEICPDLTGASLSGMDLRGIYLIDSDVRDANFESANLGQEIINNSKLSSRDFPKEIKDHLAIGGEIHGLTSLVNADARGANFRYANLREADLSGADLTGSRLQGASLGEADLRFAILKNTDLRLVDFSQTKLNGADFSEALIGWTTFGNNDLSAVKGLDTVQHNGPSTIGIDTILLSHGNIPEVFLKGAGVPDTFIIYSKSLVGSAIEFYSCFISHSTRDKRFCQRLHADLQAQGVRTWYFTEDAIWGKTVWGEIDRSIKIYDKLIIVCSKNSLQSGPVLRELERALNREDRERRSVLFPIRIDNFIFESWNHERKDDVLKKVVGDFTSWNRSAMKYEIAFEKLLKALQTRD
jgi:TIR domain-containing protein/pentapeptide repeat protein